MSYVDRPIASVEEFRAAVTLAKATTVKGPDGKDRPNLYYNIFWPRDLPGMPGIYRVFTATSSLGGENLRSVASISGTLFVPHQELAERIPVDGFSDRFLSQTPEEYLNSTDKALVGSIEVDNLEVLRTLADRASQVSYVMILTYLHRIYEMVEPAILDLLNNGYNGYDLSGDRLALMYQNAMSPQASSNT